MRIPSFLLAIFMAAVALSMFGCGTAHSYAEREHRYKVITDKDLKQLVDDVDLLLQMERPWRLTRWSKR